MSDVLYIREAAQRLGKTEKALRALINRRSKNIPPHFKIGGMWAFECLELDRWLKARKYGDDRNA